MNIDYLQQLKQAIEALPAGARASLERWFYTQLLPRDDEKRGDGIAEPAPVHYAKRTFLSPEEYLELEKESDIRHEYVAGDLYAMSGTCKKHNCIALNLAAEFRRRLRGGPCQAHMADIKVRIRLGRVEFFYYPDVMVVCGDRDPGSHHVEDPKLIVEVLSPSTERTDRIEKAMNYRRLATLEEYVLVAQDFAEVTLFRRSESWLPQRVGSSGTSVEFRSIGLALRLSQIYEGVTFRSAATMADPAS